MKKPVIGVFLLLISVNAWANQHSVCQQISVPISKYSSQQWRDIGRGCHNPVIAELFFNRAYHLDLVAEARALSTLIKSEPAPNTDHFYAYRVYMALIESLAPQWFANPKQRAAFLNGVYERRSEIAELRLHGNLRRAQFLEKNARK